MATATNIFLNASCGVCFSSTFSLLETLKVIPKSRNDGMGIFLINMIAKREGFGKLGVFRGEKEL